MIGKISFGRIEPCFMAAKPACGEISRVKKESQVQNFVPDSKNEKVEVDTFTSSKVSGNNQNSGKSESKHKVTRQGN